MRVIVTGGSGYVGRVVVQRLATEHEVVVFDREPPEADVAFVAGDIRDLEGLRRACSGAEAVVHLAAIPVPFRDPDDLVMEVNVMGTERVVAAAVHCGVRRLVFASSDSTLGFVFGEGQIVPQYLPCDEDHPLCPRDAYGLSKLIGEEICRRYTRLSGMETVCLRYCWVWSEREYHNLTALQNQPQMFVGQLWGYVDVRDVAQAVAKSLVAPAITHETLFISARRTFMPRPTLELIREFLPPTLEIRQLDSFEQEPRRCLHDYSRARRIIGYEPEHDWEAYANH
ncbi:MAG: NAD-dependent epimerase/dehydratase family protein [Candidatus Zipacnadales bacterium]